MKYGNINQPKKFFHELGGLHDARIESFKWIPPEQKVLIKIDDLNSNFIDLPEYDGLWPGILVFSNVKKILTGVVPIEGYLSIFNVEIKLLTEQINVTINISPGGKIEFDCSSIDIQEKEIK